MVFFGINKIFDVFIPDIRLELAGVKKYFLFRILCESTDLNLFVLPVLQSALENLIGLVIETNVQVNCFQCRFYVSCISLCFLSLQSYLMRVAYLFRWIWMLHFAGWRAEEIECPVKWSFCQGFHKQWAYGKFLVSYVYFFDDLEDWRTRMDALRNVSISWSLQNL